MSSIVLCLLLSCFSFHLGFIHPLQDVALHQCLPLSSVCCFPVPGGSLLPCYVVLPTSAWSSPWSLPSPMLPLIDAVFTVIKSNSILNLKGDDWSLQYCLHCIEVQRLSEKSYTKHTWKWTMELHGAGVVQVQTSPPVQPEDGVWGRGRRVTLSPQTVWSGRISDKRKVGVETEIMVMRGTLLSVFC